MAKWEAYKTALASSPPTRERFRAALCWAICTVHSSVKVSEGEFVAYYVNGKPPKSLSTMRHRALSDVEKWLDTLDFDRYQGLPTATMLDGIVNNVKGLSYTKAAFALDFAMLANIACLDIWMIRGLLGMDRAPSWRNVDHYLDLVRQAFGIVDGSGSLQWKEYYRINKAFRSTSHAVVFAAMGVETERQLTFWK